jgi:predicted amidophosphoribosyltransferase
MDIAWVMDSECCCKCGALLDYWERDLCFDCQEDQAYDEEQERFLDWYEDAEWPTIGTPEEAYAVALSLSDEDYEQ